MINETFKETGEKAFMAGMFAASKALGKDVMGLSKLRFGLSRIKGQCVTFHRTL